MAALHPLQCLISTEQHIIVASGTKLSLYNSSGHLVSSSSNHTALVRLLATYTEGENTYLISTGEDKHLHVSILPSLELESSRELVKRANALQLTHDGTIIVGDKFGDVYSYPLHAPAPPAEPLPKGTEAPKHLPLLGHVSMLNTLCLVRADQEHGLPRDLIVTGDRDEHVRVSRFPKGHVIERFLWGSKKFISALTYIPSTASSPTPLLLSAGGDPSIQIFDLSSGAHLSSFPIEEALEPYVTVGPELPTPVPAGRKKNKAEKKKEKGKGKEAAEEGGDSTPAATEGEAEVEAEVEERDPLGWKDGFTTGLAIIKMVVVGSREEGGVLVLASGCTALLYIPFSLLLGTSTTASTSLLDLTFPILDITPSPSTPDAFFVSVDVHRGTTPTATAPLLRQVTIASHSLSSLASEEADAAISKSASSETEQKKLPNVASLYPVLSLLHHPDQGFEETAEDVAEIAAGKGRGKGRKELKRQAESSPARDGSAKVEGEKGGPARKTGKRAAGRAEIRRRLEEQKVMKEKGQEVSEGEKVTEEEKMEVEAAEGA
ncbi:hypothetical protein BCR35DRAFT_356084 [Leucosporidium creatinivorum]|uniref:Uncharacterized protein n=1 Tax=Leucosporidium creatinivorum TaxID=106004 RepID=A0A1Y2CW17_9BASI|nr:hypothetical protein BCR35DRAFT_356084 [Leucosporidium creatinivorum]